MVLLALCFAAALPLFAHEPQRISRWGSGPEPSGLQAAENAWRALSAGPGIEVRDANNQAVSRAVVEREIKAGSFALLAQAASLVSLPKSRLLLEMLERATLLAAVVRRERPSSSGHESVAAGLPVRKPALLAGGRGGERAFLPVLCPGPCSNPSLPAASRRVLPLVLRC